MFDDTQRHILSGGVRQTYDPANHVVRSHALRGPHGQALEIQRMSGRVPEILLEQPAPVFLPGLGRFSTQRRRCLDRLDVRQAGLQAAQKLDQFVAPLKSR